MTIQPGVAPNSVDTLAAPVAPLAPLPAETRRIGPAWIRLLVSSPLAVLGMALFALIVALAFLGPLITRYAPLDMIGPLGGRPSGTHWFGTNDTGQDIFSQVVYGARYSLAVGLGAGTAITVLAAVVGMTSGYVGRWLDDLLSMTMNVFLIVPQLPLLVVIAAYVPFIRLM